MSARKGLDFRTGDKLLAKGHRLTARDLALVAGMNHPLVPVHRQPKVALFATGDELVPPGTEPGPGQIVYSNGFALAALIRAEGADCHRSRRCARQARRDDRGGAARPRSRRRYSGDHRRRFGRRLRFRQPRFCRRRHDTVVLEDRDAARPAADARPARRHGGARPAGQSGLVLCLRVSVSGAADPQAHRPRRSGHADRDRRRSAATCRRTTSAPIICARCSPTVPTDRSRRPSRRRIPR